ncbi:MAG: hypothetical protein GWN84_14465 [Gammaproteobacteria bacterium]|nr:hypothetical protein [Gammaproteobacteria bacterium]NIR84003.1 hypothetical protein [Gammaproteobacteria bacterium]NIR89147.1 hypothetical protein [Gammaproteobacteria bacterium]NIU04949.1 hypothetical protein [Gammaproteobacteria bacterium]NIV52115.1 hypothetical protein [Gammaproteobacteria bacterium]
MGDWNVVASVHERGFVRACELLGELAPVSRTEFYNVLVMKVEDVHAFLEALRRLIDKTPDAHAFLARVVTVTRTFTFQTPEEFETKASDAAAPYVAELAGKRFHVRMRRRGFKGKLSSQHEERFLDEFLLRRLEENGTPGHIDFEDPDAVIAVETLGQRAGLSLWTREDLERYRFVRVD